MDVPTDTMCQNSDHLLAGACWVNNESTLIIAESAIIFDKCLGNGSNIELNFLTRMTLYQNNMAIYIHVHITALSIMLHFRILVASIDVYILWKQNITLHVLTSLQFWFDNFIRTCNSYFWSYSNYFMYYKRIIDRLNFSITHSFYSFTG